MEQHTASLFLFVRMVETKRRYVVRRGRSFCLFLLVVVVFMVVHLATKKVIVSARSVSERCQVVLSLHRWMLLESDASGRGPDGLLGPKRSCSYRATESSYL